MTERRVILYSLRALLQSVLLVFGDDQGMKRAAIQLLGTVEDRLDCARTVPPRRPAARQ